MALAIVFFIAARVTRAPRASRASPSPARTARPHPASGRTSCGARLALCRGSPTAPL